MVGVPHAALVRKVELGGMNLTNTAGAVPKLAYGLVVSVPPEISLLAPAVPRLPAVHVVTNVKVVLPALTAAVIEIVSVV